MATSIEADRVQELLASGAQLVEVLPGDEYQDQHLPGALRIPLRQLDAASSAQLDRSRPIIVYCWDYI